MKKTDLLIGALIGFILTFLGVFLFIEFFTEYHFLEAIQGLKKNGFLGKLITLGAILNIFAFFILLKFNKELMARGIILSILILSFLTLFI